jgi:hypothetical protein
LKQQAIKTDNKNLNKKVLIRKFLIDGLGKKELNVLDAFSGYGTIYDKLKKQLPDKKLNVVSIEKADKKKGAIKLDNLKVLLGMNLENVDIVDLDSYGFPFAQLEIILSSGFHGLVFFTAGTSGFGQLPFGALKKIGYTERMIKKCPTLFSKNREKQILRVLSSFGLKEVFFINFQKTLYFGFQAGEKNVKTDK